MNSKLFFLLSVSFLFILSCSNNDNAGSTTVGNGLASSVVSFDNQGTQTQIKLYSQDPTDTIIYITQSSDEGQFQIPNLPYGNYNIEVMDTSLQVGLWVENLSITASSSIPDTLHLDSLQTLIIFLNDSLQANVPNFVLSTPNEQFSAGDIKHYDSQLIGIEFSNIPPGQYSKLELNEKLLALKTWQSITISKDSSNHLYWSDSIEKSPKPLWSFPLLVGVSDSMVKHFGTLEDLQQLITTQINEAQKAFINPQIHGHLNFYLDSIYVFSGDLNSQNTPPPLGFAYKLLYSPFEISTIGNWSEVDRVGVNDFPESQSTFGDLSHKTLAWLFGLFRGAHYSSIEEVTDSKNLISNSAYNTAPVLMSLRSIDSLSDYTISILNKNQDSWLWSSDTLSKSISSRINLQFLDSNRSNLEGVEVEVFGVIPNSFEVSVTHLLKQNSNADGTIDWGDLHFLDPNSLELSYSNFLIKTSYKNKVNFYWLPYSEIGLYSLQNPNSKAYIKTILIKSP